MPPDFRAMIYHARDNHNGPEKKREKPPKPYKGFPLTAYDNGQCRRSQNSEDSGSRFNDR